MLAEQSQPIDLRFLFATGNDLKVEQVRWIIAEIVSNLGGNYKVVVDSINPEKHRNESGSEKPDNVAKQKVTTIIEKENLFSADTGMTLVGAVDIVTILRSQNGEEKDLKRLSRNINIDKNLSVKDQWKHVENVLRIAKADLIKRCTQPFTIVWNIGGALESTDGKLASSCALVVEADFDGLAQNYIEDHFIFPQALVEMKLRGEAPTLEILKKYIPGIDIGPRLPFAEYIQNQGAQQLRVYNRDYPEDKYFIPSDVFDKLVRFSCLPPDVALQMLAGAYDPTLTLQQQRRKPTKHLVFSSVVQSKSY